MGPSYELDPHPTIENLSCSVLEFLQSIFIIFCIGDEKKKIITEYLDGRSLVL